MGEVSVASLMMFSQLTSLWLLRASLFLVSSSAMLKKEITGGSEEVVEMAEESMASATDLAAYLVKQILPE